MGAQLPTTSILAAMYSLILVVHAQGQGDQIPDFTCTRYTAGGDVQLTEGQPIMVHANTLQSITCTNRTAEIIDITYKFTPNNAVIRMTKNYVPLYKYELKFIMNCSAALTVQGLNETTTFNANYTLEINIQVKGSECSLALSSFNPSHKLVYWTFIGLVTLWCMNVNTSS